MQQLYHLDSFRKGWKRYDILILCFLGTFVRIMYGLIYEPWLQAPDHLAWELLIEQGSFRYDHLIHYPHEGGSILISIIGLLVEQFSSFSSLTITAVLLDFVVRFTQIFVVKKVFNARLAALFGVWTIFTSPIIIPWGTLNFGLHYLSSIFPFILLYLLYNYKGTLKYQLMVGVSLGMFFWFSYSNAILIPVFLVYCLASRQHIKKWIFAIASLVGVLAVHLLVRKYGNAGFMLSEFQLSTIRGEVFSLSDVDIWSRVSNLPRVFANSQIALPEPDAYLDIITITLYALGCLALVGLFISYRKRVFPLRNFSIVLVIVFFLVTYVVSPFFYDRDYGGHIALRHLTYIAPMIALGVIWGLSSFKYSILVVPFLALSIIQSSRLFSAEKAPRNPVITKASGWVLATKMGHDPAVIQNILRDNPDESVLLLEGVGWGSSTTIINDVQTKSLKEKEEGIRKLVDVIVKYPKRYQSSLWNGIEFSFSDQVTPRLDQELLPKLKEEYNRRQ